MISHCQFSHTFWFNDKIEVFFMLKSKDLHDSNRPLFFSTHRTRVKQNNDDTFHQPLQAAFT